MTLLPSMLTYDMGVTLEIHTAGHLPAFSYALLQNCQIFIAVPWWLIILFLTFDGKWNKYIRKREQVSLLFDDPEQISFGLHLI